MRCALHHCQHISKCGNPQGASHYHSVIVYMALARGDMATRAFDNNITSIMGARAHCRLPFNFSYIFPESSCSFIHLPHPDSPHPQSWNPHLLFLFRISYMASAHEDHVSLLQQNELDMKFRRANERASKVPESILPPPSFYKEPSKGAAGQGALRRLHLASRQSPSDSSRLMWITCIGLHAALVAIYSLILLARMKRLEYRQIIQEDFRDIWSTGLTMVTQAFVVLYCTALLFFTQSLSIRKNLLARQTLTATHDVASSWTGLGSALMSLVRQLSIRTSIMKLVCVTLYLGCLQAINITTPAMIKVETYNYTVSDDAVTTSALPTVSGAQTDFFYTWYAAAPMLPLMKNFSQISLVGLSDSTIYDVLQPNQQGVGNVAVNATTFDVSCHMLSNVESRFDDNEFGKGWNITADRVASLAHDGGVYFWVPNLAYNLFRTALHFNEGAAKYLLNHVLYYTSLNITDSKGGEGSRVSLEPGPASSNMLTSLQVMDCRFYSSARNDTIVDANNRTILNPPTPKTESTWGGSQDTTDPTPSLQTLQNWNWITYEIGRTIPYGPLNYDVAYCGSKCDGVEKLTTLDQYLADQLGIMPGGVSPVSVPLYKVENALSNMAAALHWALTQMKPPEKNWQNANRLQSVQAKTKMDYPKQASRLHLHAGPILMGLTASVVLLILALVLTANSEGKTNGIDSTGVLQVMWLLCDRPDIQDLISQVDPPSTGNLRRAGLFPIRLADDKASGEQEYHRVGFHLHRDEKL